MKLFLLIGSLFALGLFNLETLAETPYEKGTILVDHLNNEKISIGYFITGENRVESTKFDLQSKSFVVEISAYSVGVFSIDIPEISISDKPAKCKFNPKTFDYEPIVLVDGYEVKFTQERSEDSRIIEVPFQKDSTEVEIIFTVPSDLWKYKFGCPTDSDKYSVIFSPKEQTKNSVEAIYVLCKDGQILIHKASTNDPMCVKPETKKELDERGWITCTVIMTDKEKYKIGEKITVTIKNNCAEPLYSSGNIYIAIFDPKGIAQCCTGPENETRLNPGETDYEVWNQVGIYNQAEPGMYKIRSHFLLNSDYKETTKWFEIID